MEWRWRRRAGANLHAWLRAARDEHVILILGLFVDSCHDSALNDGRFPSGPELTCTVASNIEVHPRVGPGSSAVINSMFRGTLGNEYLTSESMVDAVDIRREAIYAM